MNIVIPVDENQQEVCVSFGRAPYFMVHDTEADTTMISANDAANAQGGAGLKAAQVVLDLGADVVITVRCGQNAADVLQAAEVKIYKSAGKDAVENINAFKEEKLALLDHFHAGFHGIS